MLLVLKFGLMNDLLLDATFLLFL